MNGRNAVILVLVAVVGLFGVAVITRDTPCPPPPTDTGPPSPLKHPEDSLVLHFGTAHRIVPPFVRIEDPTAAKGMAIAIPPSATVAPGEVKLCFDLPKAGAYSLWIRAYWTIGRRPEECSNSVLVKLDDRMPTTAQDRTHRRWHWVQLRVPGGLDGVVTLEAGAHTILLNYREPGIKIDQLFVTPWHRDKFERYVPQNLE